MRDTTGKARELRREELDADLVVAGGGLSGVCCAITAARAGIKVALVQDRPVLGGNASSEVRLWVLGATSHMGNNNRWAREGGVIDELLVENMWRNPEGNAIIFDSILLESVRREENVRLFLNTAIDSIECTDGGRISAASAYCSQNQTRYVLSAPLFCDASGDGILGFLSGAAFRIGAESRAEFGELLAPEQEEHSLLGHSLYFYSRDTGRPVKYVPPSFALADIREIPRFRELRVTDSGCRLWWLEYGGTRDTVYETEEIKWELWKVAYGVWNHIKNSGDYPEAENLTLEWMGTIPGKRESRRFEGDLILTQQDIVEQRQHFDTVSFGGWAIDLHPAEGIYSEQPGCTQWHSKGVYPIPYRTMYSRNVPNLFLTGRLISASHVAFGSTRVMATCAHNGQAVGVAAAICIQHKLLPRDLTEPSRLSELQQKLLRCGQYLPGFKYADDHDCARTANITASSELSLSRLETSGEMSPLDTPVALLVPLEAGPIPHISFSIEAEAPVTLHGELWTASRLGNTTPDVKLAESAILLDCGRQEVKLTFDATLAQQQHVFVMLQPAAGVKVAMSRTQIPGIVTVWQKMNKAVAKSVVQTPPEGSGIDRFAFWLPGRRPAARNLAVSFDPPLQMFAATNVTNGYARPWCGVNAWVPAPEEKRPIIQLRWSTPQQIREIEVTFDTDFDHPMESVLLGHPERVMPSCVVAFKVYSEDHGVIASVQENHQTHWRLKLDPAIQTKQLSLEILESAAALPAIYAISCFH